MGAYDPTEGRPKIKAWMERVKGFMNPYYDEAHSVVYSICKRNETKAPWNVAAKL